MKWVFSILGSAIALLATIAVGWKKFGKHKSDSSYHAKKYTQSLKAIKRITSPLPSSDDFAFAAQSALNRRMRKRSKHLFRSS